MLSRASIDRAHRRTAPRRARFRSACIATISRCRCRSASARAFWSRCGRGSCARSRQLRRDGRAWPARPSALLRSHQGARGSRTGLTPRVASRATFARRAFTAAGLRDGKVRSAGDVPASSKETYHVAQHFARVDRRLVRRRSRFRVATSCPWLRTALRCARPPSRCRCRCAPAPYVAPAPRCRACCRRACIRPTKSRRGPACCRARSRT